MNNGLLDSLTRVSSLVGELVRASSKEKKMRIEITTCHSINAQCLDNLDQINLSSSGNILLEELYKRKLIIHDDVEEYLNYFQNVRPDLLDFFMSFYNTIVTQQDNSKFINSYKKINKY